MRRQADAVLGDRIEAKYRRHSHSTYGRPRIHDDLKDEGIRVSGKRVALLMRERGVVGFPLRQGVFTTTRDRDARPAPDSVHRRFVAEAPDQLWVAHITYVPTWAGFLYLAVVLDVYSRRVVGWAMASDLRTELALDAFNMAIFRREATQMSFITPIKAANIPQLHSGSAARRPAYAPRWDRSATVTTMRCAKASTPHSNASCWLVIVSRITARLRQRSSTSSRDGTTRTGSTRQFRYL